MVTKKPLVGIIMGSSSDSRIMHGAAEILDSFSIPHEDQIISAHRTPERLTKFAKNAHLNGFGIIIAGAGGAAHLPGMIAANTHLPVLGVPIEATTLNGLDSLLSIVQMPSGIPVGTLAIGVPGATNAALLAMQILALSDPILSKKFVSWRQTQTDNIIHTPE